MRQRRRPAPWLDLRSPQCKDAEVVSNLGHGDLVSQTLLLESLERAEVAISVYDDDGRYLAVNGYACELLGRSRAELLTHDVGDFTTGGIDRAVLLDPHRREGVRLVHRSDGTSTPVAFVVVPTRLTRMDFYLAVWWPLDADDPRAATAA
jgi:PAS domain S-box-containing protein